MKKILVAFALVVAMACPLNAQAASGTKTEEKLYDEKHIEASEIEVGDSVGTTIILPDGTVFDPVFYANSYPDVVAVIGTDANLLAQHYLTCGKAEGRLPSAYSVSAPGLAQLPILKTASGQIISSDNPAYFEMVSAARGIINAPRVRAKSVTVFKETVAEQILLEDQSVYVKISVVIQDENDLDPDVENHIFHIYAVIDGKVYNQFCHYGPELKRWEDASDLALQYVVCQIPVFPAQVAYIICAEDNTLAVYAEGIGMVNVYVESGIGDLNEDDQVMVSVIRMATVEDKEATIVDPQVVGYVTKIQ